MNKPLNMHRVGDVAPLEGMEDAMGAVIREVYEGMLNDYGNLKYFFDQFRSELEKSSPRRFPWSSPGAVTFPDVMGAMASCGIQANLEMVRVLYQHYTGGVMDQLDPGRETFLMAFGCLHGIVPAEARYDKLKPSQRLALDRTETWFRAASKDLFRKQVQDRQAGLRYSMLARAMYHLLRKELGRKPTDADLREQIVASQVCEGKQNDVAVWLEHLVS